MSKLKISGGDGGGSSPPSYYREPPLASIDVSNEENLEKWESILKLSRVELLEAVNCFGPIVRDIRRGLRASHNDEAA